jgi:hypothetical protein
MIGRPYAAILALMLVTPAAAFALDSSSMEITPPVPTSISGGPDPLEVGNTAIIAVTILNNDEEATPFVVVYDFRDSKGITTQLDLVNGTLDTREDAAIGIAWTPQYADEYDVRVFALTEIANPVAISPVSESRITIPDSAS